MKQRPKIREIVRDCGGKKTRLVIAMLDRFSSSLCNRINSSGKMTADLERNDGRIDNAYIIDAVHQKIGIHYTAKVLCHHSSGGDVMVV
jgi:hypothetical protein